MSEKIGFVIDNVIDLPDKYLKLPNLRVVNGTVRYADLDMSDWPLEKVTEEIKKRGELPEVGIAPPKRFINAYRSLIEEGYSLIFSIHVHSKLTAFLNSARIAARMLEKGARIIVFDTETVSLASGFFC